jgi:hypothetical protein
MRERAVEEFDEHEDLSVLPELQEALRTLATR